VKTAVRGNSTVEDGDVTEDGWGNVLDAMGAEDPICVASGVEMVLLVPAVCRRRSDTGATNWSSMRFLGARSLRQAEIHGAVPCSEVWGGS
jgi:hypothetical protein